VYPLFADDHVAATARRVADARAVLAALHRRRGPLGAVGRRVDWGHVGAFGHSLGGAASAALMLVDNHVRVGVDLDGGIWGPVDHRGLSDPFLMVLTPKTWRCSGSIRRFAARLRGTKRLVRIAHTVHGDFTDLTLIKGQLGAGFRDPQFGAADGVTVENDVRALVLAFFDEQLLHHATGFDETAAGLDGVATQPISEPADPHCREE
jgi:hypothetical protein